jgi:histidyl-tRNA synthetase
MDYGDKSLKAQMKSANRLGVERVLIVGDSELESGSVVLRDMTSKSQSEIPVDEIVDTLLRAYAKPVGN